MSVQSHDSPPADSGEDSPERGEQRKFWTSPRARKQFISMRGKRGTPADELISDAAGDHWVKVGDAKEKGVAVYEWQPPVTPRPFDEKRYYISAIIERPNAVERITPTDEDESEADESEETDVETPEQEESEPVEDESEEQEVVETPEVEAEDTLEEEADDEEMLVTQPPMGSSFTFLEETENATLIQQGGYYIVENTETGETVTLPGDEWATFAPYLKRSSHQV